MLSNKNMSNIIIDAVCTKELIYPMLIDFQNGFPKEDFGITCAVVLQDQDRSRTVATELKEQVYAGKEKKEDLDKTFVLARNRKTGKVRLIELGNVQMKALTKSDLDHLEQQQKEESSKKKYTELLPVRDSVYTQGNKGITLEKSETELCRNITTIMPLEMAVSGLGVTNDIEIAPILDDGLHLSPVNDIDDFIVPPYNKEAIRLEDIYSIEKILSTRQYSEIYFELREKKYTQGLHPYILYIMQEKNMSPTLLVLAVYTNEILKILQCSKLIKEGPTMACPSKILASILDEKLENLSRQGYKDGVGFWDRLVCDAIVLLLIIGNFELKLELLCASLQLAQIEKIICLIGASIVHKDGVETVVLQLPLSGNCESLSPENGNILVQTQNETQDNIELIEQNHSNTIELSINDECHAKETKIDVQNQSDGKNGLIHPPINPYLHPRDRKVTDSLQNKNNPKNLKSRSNNVEDNGEADWDEKENWNHNVSVDRLDVCSHKNDENDGILNVYILPGSNEASAVESDSFHHTLEIIESNSKEYENKELRNEENNSQIDLKDKENCSHELTTDQLDVVDEENDLDELYILSRNREESEDELRNEENNSQIDLKDKENCSHELTTDQLDVVDEENDLDELYILSRNREESEDESDSLQHQQENMLEMNEKTLTHKKQTREEKETGDVETSVINAENENFYDEGQYTAVCVENDGNNLNIPPNHKKATDDDSMFLHQYENNALEPRKKLKRNKKKNVGKAIYDFEPHPEDYVENSNPNVTAGQLYISMHDNNVHHRDRESTEDDSEYSQQNGYSALELRKESKKNKKRTREKAKDEDSTDRKEIKNGESDITSEKFNMSVHDGRDLDDLCVLSRHRYVIENESELLQHHNESVLEVKKKSKKNKKRKIQKSIDDVNIDATWKEIDSPNVTAEQLYLHDDSDDVYMLPGERETTEDSSNILYEQHNNIAVKMKRKSKKHKRDNAEATKDVEIERHTTEDGSNFLHGQYNNLAFDTKRKSKKHKRNNAGETKGDEIERKITDDFSDFLNKQEIQKKSMKHKKNHTEAKNSDERERDTTENDSDLLHEEHNNIAVEMKTKSKKHKMNNIEETIDDEIERETTEDDSDFLHVPHNNNSIALQMKIKSKKHKNNQAEETKVVNRERKTTANDSDFLPENHNNIEICMKRKSKKHKRNKAATRDIEIERETIEDESDLITELHNNIALETKRKPMEHKNNNAEDTKDHRLDDIEKMENGNHEITVKLDVSAHNKADSNEYLLDVHILPANEGTTSLDIHCLQQNDNSEFTISKKPKKLIKNKMYPEEVESDYPNYLLDASVDYDNNLGNLNKLPRRRKASDKDSIFL